MSTTDGPGVNDFDSLRESPDPNQADGPSAFPTRAARRGAIGNPIQIDPTNRHFERRITSEHRRRRGQIQNLNPT
jgi:hypothetical protein